MALARVEGVTYAYAAAAAPALADVTLELAEGEAIALLGPSGAGKSTLVRALAALIPHFHGGRFRGRVVIAGEDTRRIRPAELAGTVASVFQDPEDQVVMARVANEVAFGLENVGTPPGEIVARAEEALDAVDALHLADRATSDLSGGELQRVVLASALALRPRLLLLDEPTSQLDPDGAEKFLAALDDLGSAVVLSEQRVGRALSFASRVVFVDRGRVLLDTERETALEWLAEERPAFVSPPSDDDLDEPALGDRVVAGRALAHAYGARSVFEGVELEVRRGELVVLDGPNGSGKTTLAKIAAGLIEPTRGHVSRRGTAGYLSQDPGRYLVRDRVLDEVALGVGGDVARARAALAAVDLEWAAERHPRDLSSGERERLGLAAVAVSEPDLLVLDEPTRGIDPERKSALAGWLERYAAGGHGVLVATHDREFPAHRRISLGVGEPLRV